MALEEVLHACIFFFVCSYFYCLSNTHSSGSTLYCQFKKTHFEHLHWGSAVSLPSKSSTWPKALDHMRSNTLCQKGSQLKCYILCNVFYSFSHLHVAYAHQTKKLNVGYPLKKYILSWSKEKPFCKKASCHLAASSTSDIHPAVLKLLLLTRLSFLLPC